jgi:hypothetical protein
LRLRWKILEAAHVRCRSSGRRKDLSRHRAVYLRIFAGDQDVSTGSYTGAATPIFHQSRQTTFSAKLVEPVTGRTLWVGNGQIDASGKLFVGVDTSAPKAAEAIFTDWRTKGFIAPPT